MRVFSIANCIGHEILAKYVHTITMLRINATRLVQCYSHSHRIQNPDSVTPPFSDLPPSQDLG